MYNMIPDSKTENARREKISAHQARIYGNRPYRNREWLYQKYVVERKTLKEIAIESSTKDSTIFRWVRNFNLPLVSASTRRKESVKCKNQILVARAASLIAPRPKGKDHWKYTPVEARTRNQFYNSTDYIIWKKAVNERDGHRCMACGKQPERLDTHHILPVRDFPQLVYAINNGISLCHSCHSKTISKEYEFVAAFKKTVNSGKPSSTVEMAIPSQAGGIVSAGRV